MKIYLSVITVEVPVFRAVCLTLLMGTVLSSVASETSEQKSEADFTTTIPKEGLERDLEQVFSLGPSATLQVIDETGKAKYLPEPSQSDDEASSGPYTAAYRFENGTCDFTQAVDFKAAFPGYTKPLWVHEESDSVESEKVSVGGPVRYTFTSPPEEYLGGGLSFCVRFKTVVASNSGSTTTTRAPSVSNSSEEDNSSSSGKPGEGTSDTEPGLSPGGDGSLSGPGSSAPGPVPGEVEDSDKHEAVPKLDQAVSEQEVAAATGSGGTTPAAQPEAHADEMNPNRSELPASAGADEKSIHESQPQLSPHVGASTHPVAALEKEDSEVNDEKARIKQSHDLESSITEQGGARLRRLSETAARKEAYLTIVVHSSAWQFAASTGALSTFLVVIAATLLPIS
ncbi:unnamed protein product [Neospora caninum Liverpool]|uniref:Toxoplasma gondii family A protein n=1 Tax=Neospora caninum (strain Liverpool) TaxID=572307 RepID=F0VRI7_NEOCL|nr:uncharacterized protein NCLIV_067600 [Neospora caninum Liverpool]CBZ56335.1 unnamed protein product [Neospora caninum Liverpool]CEL71095.1 TPA: hypothetical protein BN1204_067600 [Neospora caninum Liverpool]|eukprot:XP_003886360.1 uncharacterized protein NCLIV_067600 [Neospora caninum Liverpool]